MKIAILYSHLKEKGGAENVIFKQIELLHNRGHDTLSYFAYVDKKFIKPSSNPHCYVRSFFHSCIPQNKTTRILLSIPLAPLTLETLKDADVLLCHGYGPAPWVGYTLKKLKRLKYVSYIHSPPRFLYLTPEDRHLWRFDNTRDLIFLLSKVGGRLLKKLDYLGVFHSDKVLVNSQFTARRVKAIYDVEPIVCYPPVDMKIFKPINSKIVKKIRIKLGWPIILSTGRLAAVKRWEWLVEMMPYITKNFPSATLVVTGEISQENAAYAQQLTRLATILGVKENIKFLGFQPLNDLVALYNAADVYVYPVPNEDFGLGPIEAMACGTPAVVWDDGAGPCETVIPGKTGFRATPYCIEDFAEKTMKTLDINRELMRNFVYDFVKNTFSPEKHLKTLENTLEEVAS
ncbi:MAG: glycosyltransferase family 4 protein [Candidatus Bathyarchaeales archaeon]